MHKLNFIFLLFSLGLSPVFGQGGLVEKELNLRALNDIYYDNKYFGVRTSLPEDITFKFQRHLFVDERPTVLYTINGDTVKGNFKYNILEETLESEVDGRFYPFNMVVAFKFIEYNDWEEVSFTNLKLFDREGPLGGFLQDVSTSNDVKIRYFLVFRPGKASTLPFSETTTDDKVYIESEVLIKLNNKIVTMPDRKNEFFDLFPDKGEELKKYARKNKLKTNDPNDIGQMVSWVKSNFQP